MRLSNIIFGATSATGDEGGGDGKESSSSFLELQAYTAPIQGVLDDYTGGWALSYADLAPDDPDTFGGRAFLATNLFYALAGLFLTFQVGDALLGFMTDLAALVSYNYHYHQLASVSVAERSKQQMQSMVRLSLLLDYAVASVTIFTAFVYLILQSYSAYEHHTSIFTDDLIRGVEVGVLGVIFLTLSWRYEKGRPYMWFHSLWHLFSAYAGYLIGTANANAGSMGSAAVAAAVTASTAAGPETMIASIGSSSSHTLDEIATLVGMVGTSIFSV